MLVLRDHASIAAVEDPDLRALIEKRIEPFAEFDDYELHELVSIVIVEPGDALSTLDLQLGFPILENRFEMLVEHAGCYEIVFVLSDDGYGAEVFVKKHPDVDPQLLAMCAAYAKAESMP
jgi:hypothetical protein